MYKKILKTFIFTLIMFIGITLVNADPACEPIENNNNADNRVLTCDLEKTSTTKFEYPVGAGNQATLFENDYCVVACKEYIAFSIPSVRRVYAGMLFGYPLNVSAERSCRATYKDYVQFDTLFRQKIDTYNNGGLGALAKATLENEIYNMSNQKEDCDSWSKNIVSKYEIDPSVSLTIQTSTGDKIENYVYEESQPYSSIMTYDDTTYASCTLLDTPKFSCRNEKTNIGWTELARINGRYTIKEKEIELYYGKVHLEEENVAKRSCLAGEKYYVPLTEMTKPALNDKNDNGYKLTLNAINIGNNIDNKVAKNLDLTVNCWYQVRNLISPQPGDYFYNEFIKQIPFESKNPLFYVYRIIDLNDPFPNRLPGANWDGEIDEIINGKEVKTTLEQKYITSTADTIRDKAPYRIELDNSRINSIKRYNAYSNYVDFDSTKEKYELDRSKFIENNSSFIITKDREVMQ
ncbi:MAG: hypothetical protein PHR55_02780 [Bacilli bacterium]|nr:hypothetical protein [Bacilli bacterium]